MRATSRAGASSTPLLLASPSGHDHVPCHDRGPHHISQTSYTGNGSICHRDGANPSESIVPGILQYIGSAVWCGALWLFVPPRTCWLSASAYSQELAAPACMLQVLGSIFATSSKLVVGKEGPNTHIGACIAYLLSQQAARLVNLTNTEKKARPAQRNFLCDLDIRDLVAVGAAAGVTAAFHAPVCHPLVSWIIVPRS